jgi:hypothetical protein
MSSMEETEAWLARRRKELAEMTANAASRHTPTPRPIVDAEIAEPAPPPPPPRPDTVWTAEQERRWQEQEANREQQAQRLSGRFGMPPLPDRR